MDFKVTKEAMRPASSKTECFYCHNSVGKNHSPGCVLIEKKAKVRMIVEYEIDIPAHWDKSNVEFQRNKGSWCCDNAIEELEKVSKDKGCICLQTTFEFLGSDDKTFLSE